MNLASANVRVGCLLDLLELSFMEPKVPPKGTPSSKHDHELNS